MKLRPTLKPWLTGNGTGGVLGPNIMLDTGQAGRFASAGDSASYGRCADSRHLCPWCAK